MSAVAGIDTDGFQSVFAIRRRAQGVAKQEQKGQEKYFYL